MIIPQKNNNLSQLTLMIKCAIKEKKVGVIMTGGLCGDGLDYISSQEILLGMFLLYLPGYRRYLFFFKKGEWTA